MSEIITETDCFYHGTGPDEARKILREGFRIGLVGRDEDGDPIIVGAGNLGFGTYLTSNWHHAMGYGPAVLKVHLSRGTRILGMPPESDPKIIRYLKKEFGSSILKTHSPHRVVPHNKTLTQKEYIALLNYHYCKTDKHFWSSHLDLPQKRELRKRKHVAAMHRLGAGLQRFGFHGYGEMEYGSGMLLFQPHRIVIDDLAVVVPRKTYVYYGDLDPSSDMFLEFESIAELKRNLPRLRRRAREAGT
jgi:hypothetical protein